MNHEIIEYAKVAMEKINMSGLTAVEKDNLKRILNRSAQACIEMGKDERNGDNVLREYLNAYPTGSLNAIFLMYVY